MISYRNDILHVYICEIYKNIKKSSLFRELIQKYMLFIYYSTGQVPFSHSISVIIELTLEYLLKF
jgi:hypothetical protein